MSAEALKMFRDVFSLGYRMDKVEKKLEEVEKKVLAQNKDLEHFTQKEIDLNRRQIKIAREVQHKLIRGVYDNVMLKINKLDDNQTDFKKYGHTFQTQAITEYYNIMERTHYEEGTHPKLISLIISSMKPAILYIIEKYGDDYERLFTQIQNGTRKLALKNATDLYCRELCLKFDEELYKDLEIAETF